MSDRLAIDHDAPPRGSLSRARRWERGPEEQPSSPAPSPHTGQGEKPGWDGPTYYGRAQLKPAPFNNWVVGGYIFVAGLSGSAALLSGLADSVGGRRFEGLVRRGRWLSTLAPLVGAPMLIWDLHTPKRFYNMLRVAKARSPMSIGTWVLMAFSGGSMLASASQVLADLLPHLGWPRVTARIGHAPAAVSGMGLSVYTASLLSATSTPTWAAAPRAMAVRFGASSVAAASCALLLGERDPDTRRTLELVAAGALATELIAAGAQERTLEEKDVGEAMNSDWGRVEKGIVNGLGVALPLALLGVSLLAGRRKGRTLGNAAAIAALSGAALMRVAVMGVGDESASRPEISFHFSQPKNLPGR